MSALYPGAASRLLRGQINFETDTFKAQLVSIYSVFDAADVYITDVDNTVEDAVAVTVTDVTGGEVHCSPLTFPSVHDGNLIGGAVLYQDSGDPYTSPLIGYIDRRADSVPIAPYEGTGGDITFTFDYLVKI